MRWHRRPAVLSQACWPEQRPKGPPGSLLHMQCILLTAFCDYVVKVMESGHQDWEKTRQVTILDKEWDTENWWELGNVIWIKKKKTKTPKQTLDPALLSCHWNQILRDRWTELSFTVTAFQVFMGVYFGNSYLFLAQKLSQDGFSFLFSILCLICI